MGRKRIRTSYEALQSLRATDLPENTRHRMEGAVILYTPIVFRSKRDMAPDDGTGNEYIMGLSRAYKEELAHVSRILDQRLSLDKRIRIVQKRVKENMDDMKMHASSGESSSLYNLGRDAMEDPYQLALKLGNLKEVPTDEICKQVGFSLEERIDPMYSIRGFKGHQGGSVTNKALAAEYLLFAAILRDTLQQNRGAK